MSGYDHVVENISHTERKREGEDAALTSARSIGELVEAEAEGHRTVQ